MKRIIKRIATLILGIIITLANTMRYNWFYILLSILAPLVIYEMGAGSEIIALLFENEHWLPNIVGLVLTLILMSTTIWLIPSLSVYPITLYSEFSSKRPYTDRLEYFRYLLSIYNPRRPGGGLSQIPAKYMAMMPWTMVCSTVIQYRIGNSGIMLFAVINLGLLSVLVFFGALVKKQRKYMFSALAVFAASLTCFIIMYTTCRENGTTAEIGENLGEVFSIYSIYLISMVGTFILLALGEAWYLKLSAKPPAYLKKELRINNRIHGIVFFLTFASLIVLTILAVRIKLPDVSTLTVLLLCLNFYMLVVDILFTSQWVMSDKLRTLIKNDNKWLVYKLIVGVVFVCCIYMVFFKNTSNYHHNLPHNTVVRETESLEAYFEKWYQSKQTNAVSTTMDIYLVSGQGGGSRAAVYMLAVLSKIEISEKRLYDNMFSVSSISGSSAGIGQYIGHHKIGILKDSISARPSDTTLKKLKLAYSYNYFNSNLLGLLFYDRIPSSIKDLFYKPESKTYASFNRNYIQEMEEQRQLKYFADRITTKELPDSVYSFLQNNILDLYTEQDKFKTPLVFFNTTVLNRGQKGVFSPIKDTSLFPNNIDLLTSCKPVSFHFAEISSQSFPLLNNFSSFGEFYLGDGGIYENSGVSTTTQIYKRLRQYCNRADKKYKVRFIIINILNGKEKKSETKEANDSESILSLLLGGLSKIPFSGHEADAKLAIVQEVRMNNYNVVDSTERDTIFNIQPTEQFALSRVFSEKTLEKFISIDKLDSSIMELTNYREWLRITDSTQKALAAKDVKGAKISIYRLYTQYRNAGDKEAVKKLLMDDPIRNLVLDIAPIDLVESEYKNEIRYFHESDLEKAEKLQEILPNFTIVPVTNLQNKPIEGQLELWIQSLK